MAVEPPERASTVEVTFADADDGTRVAVEHRDLDRHGAQAPAYREGLGSAAGRPAILERFADAASDAGGRAPAAGP